MQQPRSRKFQSDNSVNFLGSATPAQLHTDRSRKRLYKLLYNVVEHLILQLLNIGMVSIYHRLAPAISQNSSLVSPPSLAALSGVPFSASVQVALFFVGVCVVHTVTAHVPIPECIENSFGRFVSMILGPVGSGAASFNSIVLVAVKIATGNWTWCRTQAPLHDAISAGAVAIRIP